MRFTHQKFMLKKNTIYNYISVDEFTLFVITRFAIAIFQHSPVIKS